MNNLKMFCITMKNDHYDIIKSLGYIPVGLGENIKSKEFFSDKTKINISNKNPFYGEYTFHYWIWKNYLEKIDTEWVGFCQYRKFFVKRELIELDLDLKNLKDNLIKNVDIDNQQYDCILGNQFSVQNFKISKIIKNHFLEFLLKPDLLFFKKKRNLKFHFDLFHGKGNFDLALNCLDEDNREDFKLFMETRISFNPHNMFICRTKILNEYYKILFPWLEKCEDIFGFDKLKGYGLQRIYGFLAERFLSYWFSKNFRVKELPIIVKDLSDYKDL